MVVLPYLVKTRVTLNVTSLSVFSIQLLYNRGMDPPFKNHLGGFIERSERGTGLLHF
jgi:hypothetical protein